MNAPNDKKCPHRVSRDGIIDSICRYCYVTIGYSTLEADLEGMEAAHVCEPARLRYYEEMRLKAMKKPPQSEGPQEIETVEGWFLFC